MTFSKVIIAEDIDGLNLAVVQALKDLNIPEEQIEYSKYCDEAFLKMRKAVQDEVPYDLLITDLSFVEDYRQKDLKLQSGEELIAAVRTLQPNIKIIVFSIEDKPYRIKSLFVEHGINGFVMKGRNSIPELKNAIEKVFTTEEKYISPNIEHVFQDRTVSEIDDYDLEIIKYLSLGLTQDEIETKFKELNISPSSKSAIEKRIGKLKISFKANNNVHLIAIAKDLGLI